MQHEWWLTLVELCRSLLLSGTWLENKTHWHGPAAVAKDFHAAVSADEALAPICTLLMQVLFTLAAVCCDEDRSFLVQ